jgi:subtilase family serine protease
MTGLGRSWIRDGEWTRTLGVRTGWGAVRLGLVGVAILGLLTVGVAVPVHGVSANNTAGPSVPAPPKAAAPAFPPSELRGAPSVVVPESDPGLLSHFGVPLGLTPIAPIHLLITLKYQHAAELAQLLAALYNPTSPRYHQYLTATEFADEFAPAPSVYSSVVGFLQSEGISSLQTHPDRTTIGFTATPAQVAAIFGTPLAAFAFGSSSYYSPVHAPALPAPIAPYVADVEGLSDFSKFLIHSGLTANVVGPTAAASTPAAPVTPQTSGFGPCKVQGGVFVCTSVDGLNYPKPITKFRGGGEQIPGADLQVPYDVAPLFKTYGYQKTGETNNTIATLLWSDNVYNGTNSGPYCSLLNGNQAAWDFYAPDVSSYFNNTMPKGQPHSDVFSMAQTGYAYSYPARSQGLSASCDGLGANIENTLDVEMAGSLSPGATVYQVFGGGGGSTEVIDQDFADVISPTAAEFSNVSGTDTAADLTGLAHVSVISNSWEVYGSGVVPTPAGPCQPCTPCAPSCAPPPCLENNPSWNSSLAQAAARGITVLASTGDYGGFAACSVAVNAYDNYGDIAVGGTTLVLDPTTLARSAYTTGSNPNTICVGKTTVCGGEIAWYQSSTGDGASGGVAPYNITEPSWQASSADANRVVRANESAPPFAGRGEPDIAAIANNTMMTLTEEGHYYNVTGFAGTAAVVLIAGTSIACPVEAGVVNAIDYVLQVGHDAHLGFLDPAAYTWGQEQHSGTLSPLAFYDVTKGGNPTFPAAPGYDLVTGWGPIDAKDWVTLSKGPYTVTFTEHGLPSPIHWNVTLGSTSQESTTTTDVFSLPDGPYSFVVPNAIAGHAVWKPAPGNVSVTVAGTAVAVNVTFTSAKPMYAVTFTETGLPSGSDWNVTLASTTKESKTTTDVFWVVDGKYSFEVQYTVSERAVWKPAPLNGTVQVNGTGVGVSVTYTFDFSLCGPKPVSCITAPVLGPTGSADPAREGANFPAVSPRFMPLAPNPTERTASRS